MATPREVAEWMLLQLDGESELRQVDAVAGIEQQFGSEFLQVRPGVGVGIHPSVLRQFRKLSDYEVVWVTWHGGGGSPDDHWRRRQDGDDSGRIQYRYRA